jgi:hypothetical protein
MSMHLALIEKGAAIWFSHGLNRLNNLDNTFTGKKKPGLQGIHLLLGLSPPPGTIQWMCG